MIVHFPFLGDIDILLATLTVFILFCFYTAFKLHTNKANSFDILDLLMENGRISKAAVVMMGSFALTTWIMISLTSTDKLTEGYLGIYVGAWIAPVVVRLIANGGQYTPHNDSPNIDKQG
jgi:hypothetical protein